MKFLTVALLFFIAVLLIISLTYIIVTTRHKERMLLLEQGKDAHKIMNELFIPNTLRIGALLVGVGLGFAIALTLDEYVLTTLDNPAIYAGTVMICGGFSQLIYYKTYAKNWFTNK